MKKIVLFLAVIFCSSNLFAQLNYGKLSFSNASRNNNYQGIPLETISQVGAGLTAKYEANLREYYDFINSVVTNLGSDVNSDKYKAQVKALESFKNSMKKYIDSDNWFDAFSDLQKAKSQYFIDFQQNIAIHENVSKTSNERSSMPDESNALNHVLHGNEALCLTHYQDAIDEYDKSLRIGLHSITDYSKVYYGKAVAYFRLNDFNNALANVKRLLEIDPNDPKGEVLKNQIETMKH
jgi:tetratricopeptide (TPR) repeat protein